MLNPHRYQHVKKVGDIKKERNTNYNRTATKIVQLCVANVIEIFIIRPYNNIIL
jgi:hypothetical protein